MDFDQIREHLLDADLNKGLQVRAAVTPPQTLW